VVIKQRVNRNAVFFKKEEVGPCPLGAPSVPLFRRNFFPENLFDLKSFKGQTKAEELRAPAVSLAKPAVKNTIQI
jgi:hypothetical protein